MRLAFKALIVSLLLVIAPAAIAQSEPAPVATAEQHATVLSFETEDQLNGLAAAGKTVVFFYAAWCPNCRATVAELNARWDEVNPELTLVIADYDKETALKAKYGITYQDTFVLLDATGAGIEVWNAGGVDGLNMYTLDD